MKIERINVYTGIPWQMMNQNDFQINGFKVKVKVAYTKIYIFNKCTFRGIYWNLKGGYMFCKHIWLYMLIVGVFFIWCIKLQNDTINFISIKSNATFLKWFYISSLLIFCISDCSCDSRNKAVSADTVQDRASPSSKLKYRKMKHQIYYQERNCLFFKFV